MWEENPREFYSMENTHNQVGTENPILIVQPVGFELGPRVGRRGKTPLHQLVDHLQCSITSGETTKLDTRSTDYIEVVIFSPFDNPVSIDFKELLVVVVLVHTSMGSSTQYSWFCTFSKKKTFIKDTILTKDVVLLTKGHNEHLSKLLQTWSFPVQSFGQKVLQHRARLTDGIIWWWGQARVWWLRSWLYCWLLAV